MGSALAGTLPGGVCDDLVCGIDATTQPAGTASPRPSGMLPGRNRGR
jgi:hypothetical protein